MSDTIKEIVTKPSGGINSYYLNEDNFKSKYPNLYTEVMGYDYPNDYSLRDRLYLIFYNKQDFRKCKTCNTPIKHFKEHRKSQNYCSAKCMNSSPAVKEKRKRTCNRKYGGNAPASSDAVRTKMKETSLKKYGVENIRHLDGIQERIDQTCMERFGVTNPSLVPSVVEKRKQTMLQRFGVVASTQCPELLEKIQMSGFRRKDYIFPSGKIISIQGYEDKALDLLIKEYVEEDIITSLKEVPMFWYTFETKKCRYFPDIYIPSENLIIEVNYR